MLLYAVRFFFAVLVLQLTWTFINTMTARAPRDQAMPCGWSAGVSCLSVVVMLIEWLTAAQEPAGDRRAVLRAAGRAW